MPGRSTKSKLYKLSRYPKLLCLQFVTCTSLCSVFTNFFPPFFFLMMCSKVFCKFLHGKFSDGVDVDTEIKGNDLAKAFDDCGEFEGEMMDFLISHWKADPSMNHAFDSGSRVLMSPYFLTVQKTIAFFITSLSHMCVCVISVWSIASTVFQQNDIYDCLCSMFSRWTACRLVLSSFWRMP